MRIYAAWTKMSTFAPDISHSLQDIFNDKIPAVANTDEGDVKATEKHLVRLSKPRAHFLPQVSDNFGEASTIISLKLSFLNLIGYR